MTPANKLMSLSFQLYLNKTVKNSRLFMMSVGQDNRISSALDMLDMGGKENSATAKFLSRPGSCV